MVRIILDCSKRKRTFLNSAVHGTARRCLFILCELFSMTMSSMPSSTDPSADILSSRALEGHKRVRSQLSCTLCRIGKLRCDRGSPSCDQCVKRGRGLTCQYVALTSRDKPRQHVRDRIKHLERTVIDLMNANASHGILTSSHGIREHHNGASLPTQLVSTHVDVYSDGNIKTQCNMTKLDYHPGTAGQMKINRNETTYVGASHWAAILNDVGFSRLCNSPFRVLHCTNRSNFVDYGG